MMTYDNTQLSYESALRRPLQRHTMAAAMTTTTMRFTTLGRTGLKASVVGLGCGGPSRLGLKHGATRQHAVAVIRHALDRGINYLDTAAVYTTEPQVAQAIGEAGRDDVIVSTKVPYDRDGQVITADELIEHCEQSLVALATDRIDIFNLHAVEPPQYPQCADRLIPAMLKLRQQGKIRFLGITENFNTDHRHAMLQQAKADDCWDVWMVGFNLLNQTARDLILPHTMRHNIGTQGMFVVRRALSNPQRLHATINKLLNDKLIDPDKIDVNDPLGFLVEPGVATSVTEAAYRFALHEPGMDLILTGTGNVDHLDQNIAAALAPPLPDHVQQQLRKLFARVDNVAGN